MLAKYFCVKLSVITFVIRTLTLMDKCVECKMWFKFFCVTFLSSIFTKMMLIIYDLRLETRDIGRLLSV